MGCGYVFGYSGLGMNDFRRSKLDDRYLNDATFHTVVNSIYQMIATHGITPSELREAMFLAHYRYEMENPRAMDCIIKLRMAEYYGYDDK